MSTLFDAVLSCMNTKVRCWRYRAEHDASGWRQAFARSVQLKTKPSIRFYSVAQVQIEMGIGMGLSLQLCPWYYVEL